MSEENREEKFLEESASDVHTASSRAMLAIGLAVVGVVILGGLGLWYFRDSGEGRPVSAPRTVSFGDNSGSLSSGTPVEEMVTLHPDDAERMGLKIETVGETLSSEVAAVAATGIIEPNAYRETPVISLLGGVLRGVSGELGATVGLGQTVAVIFSDELAASQSRYLALRTEAQAAKQNYERTAKLVNISPVSNAELDQALAELRMAEAEMEEHHSHHSRSEKLLAIGAISREEYEQTTTMSKVAQAKLDQANYRYSRAVSVADINPVSRSEFEQAAVKLQTAESDLAVAGQRLVLLGMPQGKVNTLRSPSQISSEIALTAPVSGTITKRDVNQGEVVEANKEIMRVTDLSDVWAIAQVYEKDLAFIRIGTGASVTTDAYPDRVFRGRVTYIDPNINPETRTVQVRIELGNPGRVLKIGMYVNAVFGAGGAAERTIPVIPTAAVQNMTDRQVVFVATDNPNVFAVRRVRLGAANDGRSPVLEGLNVGDRVVTDGSFLLRAQLLKQVPVNH